MAKYKLLAAVNSADLRLSLRKKLGRLDDIALVGFASIDADVISKVSSYSPHVVLLVQENSSDGVIELAQRIYQGKSGCALVLMTHDKSISTMQLAMQVGIRHVISLDEIDTLPEIISQAAVFEIGRAIESRKEPRIISVYGSKGGTGKTTVAVNLAVALTSKGHRTALIDLCLYFGDASILLNLSVKDTIAELVQEKSKFNIDDIKSFSMQHKSGLSTLCSPTSPKYAEYITPRHVERLLSIMRPYYDYIIIDLPCNLAETTITALENSDDILLIANRDIQNLSRAKSLMDILIPLQQNDKVNIVINADRKSVVSNKDFEYVLEIPVAFSLPEDIMIARTSQERGVPIVSSQKRTKLSRAINNMADYWINNEFRSE